MMTSETSIAVSVEDQLSITELLSKYGLLLDSQRNEAWVELFEPEARIEIAGRPPIGTAEGRRQLAENSARGVHISAPPIIVGGTSQGIASVQQSFLFHNTGTGQVRSGWYEDSVVKREGQWYLSVRVVHFFEGS